MNTLDTVSADVASARRYTNVAIILHWVIAIAIFAQFAGGKWMTSASAAATGSVFTIFQIHKTIGLTILGLTIARIIWRLAHPSPALPAGMNRFEVFAASITHIAFYGFLILIPLSGWAMASVSPTGVPTFFLLLESLPFGHLPLLGGEASLAVRHSAEVFLKGAHENLSLAMGLLVALHVAAALKHQFLSKDNLIARMVLSARTLPQSTAKAGVGLLAVLATLAFLGGGIVWGIVQKTEGPASQATSLASASTSDWVIDHHASELGFTITFSGNDVFGEVANWSGDINFDPQSLEDASATITIDMASITLSNSTVQAQAAGGDGFDLANHSTATYEASAFVRNDDGSFSAAGTLTVRGISVSVPLTFTFEEVAGAATVQGRTVVNRLNFDIGAIGAADEAWLLYGVDVTFSLTASRVR